VFGWSDLRKDGKGWSEKKKERGMILAIIGMHLVGL
jgi:hypothetical protein